MASPINKIELKHFRGATKPAFIEFDRSKKTVVIFGENGRGKSTLVDAVDMVANQSAGSLADKSSTRLKDHLPSIGKAPKDLCVELHASPDKWRATLNGARISVSPSSSLPKVHILRRSQLLTLIEAIPSERYEALRKLIDVGGVEK